MGNTVHSTGRWNYEAATHPEFALYVYAEDDKDNETICAIPEGPHAEERARLFVAAPELLEACQALFQVLNDNYIGETPDEELDEREQEALKLYEAATNKAAGPQLYAAQKSDGSTVMVSVPEND